MFLCGVQTEVKVTWTRQWPGHARALWPWHCRVYPQVLLGTGVAGGGQGGVICSHRAHAHQSATTGVLPIQLPLFRERSLPFGIDCDHTCRTLKCHGA